jgi:hypothetical protein
VGIIAIRPGQCDNSIKKIAQSVWEWIPHKTVHGFIPKTSLAASQAKIGLPPAVQTLYHLIEIKYYCEDTRPQNLLSAAQEQHNGLYSILAGASVTLRTILLEVCGTIYNRHTLEPFKDLGLDSQRVQKLASKLHAHSVNYAAKLAHSRRANSSTIIPYQACPFQHFYQMSSGDDFRSSLISS